MVDQKKFLVDVGMDDLPFPMKVISRADPEGQATVANISARARIMSEFEARWIDKFIQLVHEHRDRIGTTTLRTNIRDYVEALEASSVTIDFDYPFFIEKLTPVSREKCLVRYLCTYSVTATAADGSGTIAFSMEIPAITTYPGSAPDRPGGLFGQLSVVALEVTSDEDVYPEDLVEIVDRHALSPVYSFLPPEDQLHLIEKVHTEQQSSVTMVDKIKDDLARRRNTDRYSIRCANFGMLHSYSTVIGTKKSRWVPSSAHQDDL